MVFVILSLILAAMGETREELHREFDGRILTGIDLELTESSNGGLARYVDFDFLQESYAPSRVIGLDGLDASLFDNYIMTPADLSRLSEAVRRQLTRGLNLTLPASVSLLGPDGEPASQGIIRSRLESSDNSQAPRQTIFLPGTIFGPNGEPISNSNISAQTASIQTQESERLTRQREAEERARYHRNVGELQRRWRAYHRSLSPQGLNRTIRLRHLSPRALRTVLAACVRNMHEREQTLSFLRLHSDTPREVRRILETVDIGSDHVGSIELRTRVPSSNPMTHASQLHQLYHHLQLPMDFVPLHIVFLYHSHITFLNPRIMENYPSELVGLRIYLQKINRDGNGIPEIFQDKTGRNTGYEFRDNFGDPEEGFWELLRVGHHANISREQAENYILDQIRPLLNREILEDMIQSSNGVNNMLRIFRILPTAFAQEVVRNLTAEYATAIQTATGGARSATIEAFGAFIGAIGAIESQREIRSESASLFHGLEQFIERLPPEAQLHAVDADRRSGPIQPTRENLERFRYATPLLQRLARSQDPQSHGLIVEILRNPSHRLSLMLELLNSESNLAFLPLLLPYADTEDLATAVRQTPDRALRRAGGASVFGQLARRTTPEVGERLRIQLAHFFSLPEAQIRELMESSIAVQRAVLERLERRVGLRNFSVETIELIARAVRVQPSLADRYVSFTLLMDLPQFPHLSPETQESVLFNVLESRGVEPGLLRAPRQELLAQGDRVRRVTNELFALALDGEFRVPLAALHALQRWESRLRDSPLQIVGLDAMRERILEAAFQRVSSYETATAAVQFLRSNGVSWSNPRMLSFFDGLRIFNLGTVLWQDILSEVPMRPEILRAIGSLLESVGGSSLPLFVETYRGRVEELSQTVEGRNLLNQLLKFPEMRSQVSLAALLPLTESPHSVVLRSTAVEALATLAPRHPELTRLIRELLPQNPSVALRLARSHVPRDTEFAREAERILRTDITWEESTIEAAVGYLAHHDLRRFSRIFQSVVTGPSGSEVRRVLARSPEPYINRLFNPSPPRSVCGRVFSFVRRNLQAITGW